MVSHIDRIVDKLNVGLVKVAAIDDLVGKEIVALVIHRLDETAVTLELSFVQ